MNQHDPIRRVSVVSTGQVQIRPDHLASSPASRSSPVPGSASSAELDPAAANPRASDPEAAGPQAYRSFGWARATGPDGATTQAWLQTGEAYAFTAAASIRAVEETLTRSLRGAFSPTAAFGADFVLTIPDTTRIDTIPAEAAAGRR